jgi:NAD(P)-dependent dehydrogenase (short-subunit alcohol dehydrogenase family)
VPDPAPSPTYAPRFAGKVALLTGAAGGIGLAAAGRLAREGCRVMLTDIDAARLERAVEALAAEGLEAAGQAADLCQAREREDLVPAVVRRWGRIDILVNNAADHGSRMAFLDQADEEWERIFRTNVAAAAALCRAAAQDMRRRRSGAIVNVGSVQLAMPVLTYAPYVSSKGAITGLTRALAVELAVHDIRVNAVVPGVIATESFRHHLQRVAREIGAPTMPDRRRPESDPPRCCDATGAPRRWRRRSPFWHRPMHPSSPGRC